MLTFKPANTSLETLYQEQHTSEEGLNHQEAANRLEKYGPNEPTPIMATLSIRAQIGGEML
jgi:hypothetical protein